MTKTQVDRLGSRLKAKQATPEDLRLLDEFRRSFSTAYENVIRTITVQLRLKPTGRPAKSSTSVSEKLRRESIRLTQIQDIAGCRLIVSDIPEQEQVVADLIRIFPGATVIDRRASPSHGYRAVHVVVDSQGKLIEIQVRTSLQHLWAELSEKYSDLFDPAIKYGSGNEDIRITLISISKTIAGIESAEQELQNARLNASPDSIVEIREKILKVREDLSKWLEETIAKLAQLKGGTDAVSD